VVRIAACRHGSPFRAAPAESLVKLDPHGKDVTAFCVANATDGVRKKRTGCAAKTPAGERKLSGITHREALALAVNGDDICERYHNRRPRQVKKA
jgi:hypothetical protein